MTHNERQSVLNSIDGNTLLLPDTSWIRDRQRVDEEYNFACPHCDCAQDHRCINCDKFIYINECINNEGYCEFCADQGDLNGKA